MSKRKGNPAWTKGGPSPNPSGKSKARPAEATRRDVFVEVATGYGIAGTDPTASAVACVARVAPREGLELWKGSDIGARIVETLPSEALRAGFEVEVDDDELSQEITDEWDELKLLPLLSDALNYTRAAGFRGVLINTDDPGDIAEPLDIERVRGIQSLVQLDHDELTPVTYYGDILSPKYGEVETWSLTPRAAAGHTTPYIPVVHESRLLIMRGPVVGRLQDQMLPGLGDSVFVRCKQVIANHDLTWASVVRLVQDCSLLVLKMAGLAHAMGSEDGYQMIANRLRAISVGRSHSRTLLVDTMEEMERVNASLSHLPEVIDQLNTRLAMAADLPVTRLLGISPAGMSSTGEADRAFLQDRVVPWRDKHVIPLLNRIVELQLAARGQAPETWKVCGLPLWQLSDAEIATRNKTQAEADKINIESQILSAAEVAKSRFGSGQFSLNTTLDMDARDESGALETEMSPEDQLIMAEVAASKAAIGAPAESTDSEDREDAGRVKRDKDGRFAGSIGGGKVKGSGGGGGGAKMTPDQRLERLAAFAAERGVTKIVDRVALALKGDKDARKQLLTIERNLMKHTQSRQSLEAIPLAAKIPAPKMKAPPKPRQPKKDFTVDTTRAAGGSQGGKWYKDARGAYWFGKQYPNAERIHVEHLSNQIYSAMGIKSATTKIVDIDGVPTLMSREVKGSQGNLVALKSTDATKGFVVDAWLANHDVAGMHGDNMIIGKGGKAARIDNGSSFWYRAMGAQKPFDSTVSELDTMRDPKYAAGQVYSKLSDADVAKQAKAFGRKYDAAKIAALVDQSGLTPDAKLRLKETLDARAKTIAGYTAATKAPEPKAGGTPPLNVIQFRGGPAKRAQPETAADKAAQRAAEHSNERYIAEHLAAVNKARNKAKNANPSLEAKDVPSRSHDEMVASKAAVFDKLTPNQQEAVIMYQTSGYKSMNAVARGIASFSDMGNGSERADVTMPDLDSAIARAKVEAPVLVHRGMRWRADQGGVQFTPGAVMIEPGYMSTSIDSSATKSFSFAPKGLDMRTARMEIEVPAGVKAMYIKSNQHLDKERELLFPRNTPMRVKSVKIEKDQNGHDIQVVRMEIAADLM